jgi:ribonuclease P protein component
MNYRLPKNERLHSKKSIQELFDKGSSFFLYPFKVLHHTLNSGEGETNVVLFSVSKKKIKNAVGRNYVKRRMKEAYRLNKSLLCTSELPSRKKIGLIYVSSELQDFQTIQKKIQKILKRIAESK